jgi:hypothetical protein
VERPKHPSGKPTRDQPRKELPIPRVPEREPLTPGLRRRELASAFGFTATPYEEQQDGEE